MKTFLVIVFFIMLAGVLRAPAFLVCEQPVKKADCVIAMLGGDFELRRQEALSLIKKGNMDTLLIPAWSKMIRYGKGNLEPSAEKTVVVAALPQKSISFFGHRIDVYENTHLELLLARDMMAKLGFKSAVVASSPYHMRRLQLIAGKVFADGGYDIGLQPTALEKYDFMSCLKSGRCRKHVAAEYLKIGWFLVYSWSV